MKAINAFPHVPQVDYDAVEAQDSKKVVLLLAPFSRDQKFFVNDHATTARSLKRMVHSSDQASPGVRASYLDYLKEIDRATSDILITSDTITNDFTEEAIEAKASKEYYSVFEGTEIHKDKFKFIQLVTTYNVLKFYNNKFKASWEALKEIFGQIEITGTNHKFMQQVLAYKIYPRLELSSLLDLLTRRLNFILRINSEESKDTFHISTGQYSDSINYSFSTVFDTEISKKINELNELSGANDEKKSKVIKKWKEAKESCFVDDYNIDCRCDEIFNQALAHTMTIDSYKLKIEEAQIKRSVYFENSVGVEEKVLRQELIRSFMSKRNPEKKIDNYNEFLYEYFSFEYSALTAHFPDLANKDRVLFMYHFSPVYFSKDVLNHMRKTRSGFIHHFTKKDTVMRELPCEYIKLALGHWWEENIYQKISRTEKNSREKYKKLVKLVNDLWLKDQHRILDKIEQNIHAKRAFQIHNLNILRPFLEAELSYTFFILYTRFLGYNFVYTIAREKNQSRQDQTKPAKTQQSALV